jgi:hypothetical protein
VTVFYVQLRSTFFAGPSNDGNNFFEFFDDAGHSNDGNNFHEKSDANLVWPQPYSPKNQDSAE